MNKKHLASRIATANEAGLVVILYEGLIDTLKACLLNIEEKDNTSFEENVDKAKNILAEFIATAKGHNDIANNLRSLFIYINNQITKGILEKDKGLFEECIKILRPLYEAWQELEKKEFEKNLSENTNKTEIIAGATYGRNQLNDYINDNRDKWGRR
ncbi:flagellar protein FliS [Lutibacter sp. B2]|nr:flagellar protein FliS [Lutibacter sp. B2]